jgi:citrate lyase subunit beta/citryl-CoA lyase
VFTAGADAVILDLEDAVPIDAEDRARSMVADAIAGDRALVRVNAPRTDF